MLTSRRFRSAAATHAGTIRAENEDSYVDRPDLGIWAVADGAGGHAAGAFASRVIADRLEAVPPGLPPDALLSAARAGLAAAHGALNDEATRRGAGTVIASTVVVLVAQEQRITCLWAGDSRAYVLRRTALSRLTRDHSLVQELIDAGALTEAEAETDSRANVITRAVGSNAPALELDEVSVECQPGDRFILCSDGISKALSEEKLARILLMLDEIPSPELLVTAALAAKSPDNLTAVSVEVRD